MKLVMIEIIKKWFLSCFNFAWYMSLGFLSLVHTLKIRLSVRNRFPFASARTNKHQCTRSPGVQDWEDVKKEHTVEKQSIIEEGVKAIIFTKKYTSSSLLQKY